MYVCKKLQFIEYIQIVFCARLFIVCLKQSMFDHSPKQIPYPAVNGTLNALLR